MVSLHKFRHANYFMNRVGGIGGIPVSTPLVGAKKIYSFQIIKFYSREILIMFFTHWQECHSSLSIRAHERIEEAIHNNTLCFGSQAPRSR